jgi:hypothetical protein
MFSRRYKWARHNGSCRTGKAALWELYVKSLCSCNAVNVLWRAFGKTRWTIVPSWWSCPPCLSSLRSCAMWETHFIPGALSYRGQRGIDGLLEEIRNGSSVSGGILKRRRETFSVGSSKMLYMYLVDWNLLSVVRRSNWLSREKVCI